MMKKPKDDPEEILNNYFVNIGNMLSQSFPSDDNYKKYLGQSNINSIYFNEVSTSEILHATVLLKTKSSSGHDTIPTRVIVSTIGSIIDI